ncbi:hypothetical protein E3N88_45482 [Mikania micrantha]|uniref:Pentatricopeptide repeat-containing protein n=1 Tax=Mikania micrantha TaxID=192012 RepID=A0A5N6L9C2_9ASTR|nr:hypothetical protein E3N88_45482 [Mikania micrantha]
MISNDFGAVQPDKYTYTFVLKACTMLLDIEEGILLHEEIAKKGLEYDVFIGTGLIDMYCKCGHLFHARQVFDKMPDRDVAVWNAMLSGLSQSSDCAQAVEFFCRFALNGCHYEVLELFDQIKNNNLNVNMVSVVSALSAAGETKDLVKGKMIHECVKKNKFDSDIRVSTPLITMYAKCGELKKAHDLFNSLSGKDMVAWSAVIAALTQSGYHEEAISLFCDMQHAGFKPIHPDPGTIVGVVSASAHLADLKLGTSIHGLVMKCGFESDCHVNNALIDMYSKSRSLSSAELLFGLTKNQDQVLWNVMIGAYMRNGYAQESIYTFHQMKSEGFRPSLVAFVSTLPAVAYLAAIKEGTSLHASIYRMGYISHTIVFNGLIDMYSKCGRVDLSEAVFHELKDKDVVSWNVMLAGYALNGRVDCALGFFSHMQDNLVDIDPVSFLSLLSACRHAGLVKEGKHVFNLMKERHNIEPKLEHYACMVDLLGRAGLFDETLRLIESMQMEPDGGVWGGLLGACQMHGNVKLAELALDNLVRLEPRNQAHYVVLSSIYAQSGRWADARSLRLKMIESGVKKTPGWSWVNEKQDLKAWFDQAAEYWKQAIALTPSKYIEHHHLIPPSNHLSTEFAPTNPPSAIANAWSAFTLTTLVNSVSKEVWLCADHSVEVDGHRHVTELGFLTKWLSKIDKPTSWDFGWKGHGTKGRLCGIEDSKPFIFDRVIQTRIRAFNNSPLRFHSNSHHHHLLNLISTSKTLKHLLQIHAQLLISGFTQDNFINTHLIESYSLFKKINLARLVFNAAPNPSVVLWNSMIKAHIRSKQHQEAVIMYNKMISNDFGAVQPDKYTYTFVLKACTMLLDIEEGILLHEEIAKKGLEYDVFIGTGLIDMYCKCGHLFHARQVFDKMPDRDVAVWNAMLSGLSQSSDCAQAVEFFCRFALNGCHYEVLELFDQIKNNNLNVNMVSVVSALSAAGETKDLVKGKMIHECVKKNKFDSDIRVSTPLITMYAKCGELKKAHDLFNSLSGKDMVAWSAVIAALTQSGYHEEAISLFCDMQHAGFKPIHPDPGTIVGVVSASAHLADLKLGTSIHGLVMKCGFESDCHVNNALIDMYSKSRSLSSAELLFGLTKNQDQILWNVMIGAYMRNGYAQESIYTFHQMKSEGFRPSLVAFVSTLPAVAYLAAIKEGTSLHASIYRMGYISHTIVFNGLIDMYSKCGRVDLSEAVFHELKDKDVVSWNVMLAGYALNGRVDCALGFFSHMQDNLVDIDPVSFLSLLSACRHAGLVKEGKHVFKLMKERHNIEPKLEHYACMVDLLGRAGLFDETLRLIESMQMEPDGGVWGGLLGACQMHGNVKLAELALDNLVRLEPRNQAHYVVLSSIYAQSGRWADARSLRLKMIESGVKKTPGWSWVNEKQDLILLPIQILHEHHHLIPPSNHLSTEFAPTNPPFAIANAWSAFTLTTLVNSVSKEVWLCADHSVEVDGHRHEKDNKLVEQYWMLVVRVKKDALYVSSIQVNKATLWIFIEAASVVASEIDSYALTIVLYCDKNNSLRLAVVIYLKHQLAYHIPSTFMISCQFF